LGERRDGRDASDRTFPGSDGKPEGISAVRQNGTGKGPRKITLETNYIGEETFC